MALIFENTYKFLFQLKRQYDFRDKIIKSDSTIKSHKLVLIRRKHTFFFINMGMKKLCNIIHVLFIATQLL